MRVSKKFKKWCDDMKEEKRTTTNNKNEYLSDKRITELIPKHKDSTTMKNDILLFNWGDKRGITFNLFYVLVMVLVGVILLGVFGFVFNAVYNGLNQDVMLGQVNLSNATEQTYGVFINSYNNNMDLYGLFLIFGMIGGLFFASFMLRGKWEKLLIIVDLIIMVVVYITAILLSNAYESLLTASSGVITQFEGQMPKTSGFLLHLPRYVVIIGAVCMILFYSSIPRRENEQQINYESGQY
jgi:hypothetical protein